MTANQDHKKACSKLRAERIIKNLKKRGMDGLFCEPSAQAFEAICGMIPAGSALFNERD